MTFFIREISASDALPLRSRILRPNQAIAFCMYPGDDDPDTRHFGAFTGKELHGIVSIYRKNHMTMGVEGFQLRAMATSEEARGKGLGLALLRAAERHAIELGAQYIWANARVSAKGFYRKAGYTLGTEEYFIEHIGNHVLACMQLSSSRVES